jgi:putative ABC transport system permease protein
MSFWKLIKRSLGFYWRSHLGVLLAVTVSTAVLTGALVVGDSMRHSLRMMVTARLGRTKLALVGGNRFFRSKLANEIAVELNTTAAAVLQLRALISNSSGTRRANRIEVLGVDREFYEIGTGGNPFGDDWSEGIILNEALAEKLAVGVGDEVVLRIERPGVMSREVPLAPDSDLSMAFRLMISAVAGESEFSRFGLQANHIAPLNAYVPLEWLQEKLGRGEQANTLLVADNDEDTVTIENADDVSLKLRPLQQRDMLEIRSTRIFISESLASAAVSAGDGAVGILTYFVNELRSGERTTPYSIVTAAGKSADLGLIPSDMTDDKIVINQWLADDLEAQVGDLVELTYFVIGPMRKLQEQESSFRIREIIPMDSPAVDPELMPDFPGLAEAENCRDWDPGIEIDLDKIRRRDEDYWDRYRGTPKAFVTLAAGQKMWSNRYGNLTAVRYPLSTDANDLESRLLNTVEPSSLGLYFQPVREQGLRAGDEATDFRWLFLGFSMFLIIAALLLTGLLFIFGVENRSEQTGMLLALGFSPGLVKRLLLIEGAVLAAIGAMVGTATGLLYTKAMIYGLATIWQVAVSGSAIRFYAQPSTLFVGAFGGVAVSLMAMWLTLRKQMSYSARELLSGNARSQFFGAKAVARNRIGLWIAVLAATGAVLLLVVLGSDDSGTATVAFFGAGTLVLIGGLGLSWALLGMAGAVSASQWRPLPAWGCETRREEADGA